MNAQEALSYGIIDTVVGETEKTIAADRAERAVSESPVLNGFLTNRIARCAQFRTAQVGRG
jgi:hypothetical protein